MLLSHFLPLYLLSTLSLAAPAPAPAPAPVPISVPRDTSGLLQDLPEIVDGIKELLTPENVSQLKDILAGAQPADAAVCQPDEDTDQGCYAGELLFGCTSYEKVGSEELICALFLQLVSLLSSIVE